MTEELNYLIRDFGMVFEQSLRPYQDSTLRVPFYFTSTMRERKEQRGISLKMNPQSIAWRQNKRIEERKTRGGSVFYHWTDEEGRNNDILVLDFAGMTGNINIQTGAYRRGGAPYLRALGGRSGSLTEVAMSAADKIDGKSNADVGVQLTGSHIDTSGAAKLAQFWNLYSLTREPIYDADLKVPVIYSITYSSPLFGNTYITLYGHYNNVLEFSEVAEEPFNRRWSFSFTVTSTSPSLDDLYQTVSFNLGTELLNNVGQFE